MPAEFLNQPAIGEPAASRLALPEVTLVAITSVAIAPTLEAVKRCIDQIDFGRVLFLSDTEPQAELKGKIEWHKIPALRSRRQYSEFMLCHLHRHVETSHILCVQWDGFVLDPSRWSSEFLDFDFIGAPWPHLDGPHVVGNGGFSLRSLRLMQACAELNYDESEAEDTWICRTARPELEERYAMRFASPALAKRFAYERTRATGEEFGFHGGQELAGEAAAVEGGGGGVDGRGGVGGPIRAVKAAGAIRPIRRVGHVFARAQRRRCVPRRRPQRLPS